MTPLFYILTLALPFFLALFERYLPFPYIVEEIAKAALVHAVRLSNKKGGVLRISLTAGFCFALTETILYVPNFAQSGTLILLLVRLVCTFLLHSLTFSLLFSTRGRLFFVALLANVGIHFIYNICMLGGVR